MMCRLCPHKGQKIQMTCKYQPFAHKFRPIIFDKTEEEITTKKIFAYREKLKGKKVQIKLKYIPCSLAQDTCGSLVSSLKKRQIFGINAI